MIDRMMIERLRQRDETVLNDIKDQYGDVCFKTAYSMLKNKEDAEEVVSDTLFAVWNNIPPEAPDNLGGYIYKTARYIALEKYRLNTAKMRNSAAAVSIDELGDCISGGDTETDFDERQLSKLLNSFLSSQPEDSRRIFVCRYFYNMKYSEIAKKYGIGLSAVKMSLKRTKQKLKEFLTKEGY